METLRFILENGGLISLLLGQHLLIVAIAVGLAILTGVPVGIAISSTRGRAAGSRPSLPC